MGIRAWLLLVTLVVVCTGFSVTGIATGAPPPAIPEPDITVTDSSGAVNDSLVAFGTVSGGGASSHTITIANDGNTSLVLGSIALANPLAQPFSLIYANFCSDSTIYPGDNCSLTVLFTPVSNGVYNDSFDIPSDDPDENPITITISGTGTNIVFPPGSNAPDITVTDNSGSATDLSMDFGARSGGGGWVNSVTITNDGNSDLTLGSIAQSDTLSAPYSIINSTCAVTLSVGAFCGFDVLFTPTSNGIFNDTFDIPSDDPDENPVIFSVTGTSSDIVQPFPGGDADITATDNSGDANDLSIDFGIIEVGQSIDNTVTLTNDGVVALTIGNIVDAASLSTPYGIVNNTCAINNVLAPTEYCAFDVEFAPVSAGLFSAIINVPSDDPDEAVIQYSVSGIANTPGNNPPTSPTLITPVYNAVAVSQPVAFKWDKSSDPDGDSITYRLFYSTDAAFVNSTDLLVASSNKTSANNAYALWSFGLLPVGIVLAGRRGRRKIALMLMALALGVSLLLYACGSGGGDSTTVPPPPPVTTVSYTLSDTLETGTRYYWKVSADDGRGGISYSQPWTYTTN
jgi:hypothetical protein